MPAAGYRLKARRCYVRVSDARVDVFQRTCIVVRGSTKRVFNEPKEKTLRFDVASVGTDDQGTVIPLQRIVRHVPASERMNIMAEVVFDHVTRIYPGNDKPSVDDLNLDIKDGEFLVLVGPSGCGKSTTLRMLAGLEEVNKGRILIGGNDVTTMQPKDRDIAMVFQNYALYPHMTVADNMGFALKIAGTPKEEIRKRVEKAAEILDLTEYLDRKPKALSGGQRQRVAMGRAIVREPKVFLMDEPLSNLDAKLRVQTRTQIAALQRQLGVTTLYVTHDQTEALTMGLPGTSGS